MDISGVSPQTEGYNKPGVTLKGNLFYLGTK